jgi:hypothetical protein
VVNTILVDDALIVLGQEIKSNKSEEKISKQQKANRDREVVTSKEQLDKGCICLSVAWGLLLPGESEFLFKPHGLEL